MRRTAPLAIVTGASSGIGFELARCAAQKGFDLIVVADELEIESAAERLRSFGASVETLIADLKTAEGVAALMVTVGGRPVDALIANAGYGLNRALLEHDFDAVWQVVDTNVTGTLDLVKRVARKMGTRGRGRVLLTGPMAEFGPGIRPVVYNATKAFIDSFSSALRVELKGTDVTVTCLMPTASDTNVLASAGANGGHAEKVDAKHVAEVGFGAMLRGDSDLASGLHAKL